MTDSASEITSTASRVPAVAVLNQVEAKLSLQNPFGGSTASTAVPTFNTKDASRSFTWDRIRIGSDRTLNLILLNDQDRINGHDPIRSDPDHDSTGVKVWQRSSPNQLGTC